MLRLNMINKMDNKENTQQVIQQLFVNSHEAVVLSDGSGRWIWGNEQAVQIFALHEKKLRGHLLYWLEDDQKRWFEGGEVKKEIFITETTGKSSFSLQKTPLFDEQNNVREMVGVIRDVTHRKKREKIVQLTLGVMNHALEGVVITDSYGTITMVNPAFTTITGYESHEVIGKNPRILKSNKHTKNFYMNFWKSLIEKGYWEGEIWNRRKDGEVYPEWLYVTSVYDEKGQVTEYISVFSDLSTMKTKDAQIRLKSWYDQLTGLPNKEMFLDLLRREMKKRSKDAPFLGVLFLNINRFKAVNESLGHFSGDLLLQHVAQRLQKAAGEINTVARISGDIFYILAHQAKNVMEIAQIAKMLLECFNEPFDVNGTRFFLTARVGISVFPDDGTDEEILLQKADIALFRAKETGLNAHQFFKGELGVQTGERLLLESDLRRGLLYNEFFLYYQPQLDMVKKHVCGVEALVRWKHGKRGLIAPGDFIPTAEETGLILPLGEKILSMACKQKNRWNDRFLGSIEVSVNISPKQIYQKNFIDEIKNILEKYSIEPGQIAFEITESGIMKNGDFSLTILQKLKSFGCRLFIDDFGTGYSSLAYLSRFPVDVIKIDKSFIDGIGKNSSDELLVKTIINLAHSLERSVIAEGVETAEQQCFLENVHCDVIQGYILSRPLPAVEVPNFIKNYYHA
ncbi:sensor domain-containing protein [Aminobacterium sp. UBA4834]|uniref:sensor domain-containing protein n=2 Tax=Aminobacterium TaxID=81466 RepID=UPI00257E7086|nr:bifunctional diguanylate cyclase/phosphodiesterase [Aminobacterium sp. UBA4834]